MKSYLYKKLGAAFVGLLCSSIALADTTYTLTYSLTANYTGSTQPSTATGSVTFTNLSAYSTNGSPSTTGISAFSFTLSGTTYSVANGLITSLYRNSLALNPAVTTNIISSFTNLNFGTTYPTLVNQYSNNQVTSNNWSPNSAIYTLVSVVEVVPAGPLSADTQSSINYLAGQLQSTYAIQSSLISNGLTYDCAVFDKNGICISAGAGYTAVNSGTPSVGSGLLIGGYKLNDQVRLGAWVNQKAYNTGTVGLNAANSNPMFGLYAVWNQEKSGKGLEVRASAGYETNSTTSTRQVFGTSEAGVGTASLTTQGASLTASYNIPTIANLVASPYVGVRYTKIGLGGYTEASSSSVTTPLTYGDLNQENTTVLAGVKLFGKVAQRVGVFGSVGVEQDIQNNAAAIQASGSGQTLTNASLTSSYQATRPVATAGAYYELDKAQRVTFNAGYTQSMYMPVAVSSAYVTYTAGF